MKRGFTLVELLAVIAILAIILLIAVPKIIDYIETSKKNAFFSSAKSILRKIDYDNIEESDFSETTLQALNINELSSSEYDLALSNVIMIDGVLYLNLVGKGQYEGLYVCDLTVETKTNTVVDTNCNT